jgi:hypothetical protein
MADNNVLTFEHSDGTKEYVRPVPLISISRESLRNEMGSFGASYTITLTGSLLDSAGGVGTDNDPASDSDAPDGEAAYEIFNKQRKLKKLFSQPDLRVEINNVAGNATPDDIFHITLQSLDFQEGIYINRADYTAVFSAEYMYDESNVIHDNDLMAVLIETSDDNKSFSGDHPGTPTASSLRTQFGGLIKDLGESWSIQVEENGTTDSTDALSIINPKSYLVTRESNIVGRTYYDSENDEKHEAWSEAKNFANKMVLTDAVEEYPGYAKDKKFAHLVLNLSDNFGGFNHSRVESIDKATGTVNITDTWLMCQDFAFENYTASINSSLDSAYVAVTLNGNIKGISSIPASGAYYGGDAATDDVALPYENALKKYREVAGDGLFGVNSYVYKRANSVIEPGLNPQPQSIALTENKFNGSIEYSLTFDNRPQNIITEALSENITINDTYPGDLYALIPVIGRPEGPVMQYIGGRTEYRRDVSIELFFDYTDVDYANNTGDKLRKKLILSKPSINSPVKEQLNDLIKQLSPMTEPRLRKCFLNPPQESWNPKEARYTLSLSWVYEIGEPSTGIGSEVEKIPGQSNYLTFPSILPM